MTQEERQGPNQGKVLGWTGSGQGGAEGAWGGASPALVPSGPRCLWNVQGAGGLHGLRRLEVVQTKGEGKPRVGEVSGLSGKAGERRTERRAIGEGRGGTGRVRGRLREWGICRVRAQVCGKVGEAMVRAISVATNKMQPDRA